MISEKTTGSWGVLLGNWVGVAARDVEVNGDGWVSSNRDVVGDGGVCERRPSCDMGETAAE